MSEQPQPGPEDLRPATTQEKENAFGRFIGYIRGRRAVDPSVTPTPRLDRLARGMSPEADEQARRVEEDTYNFERQRLEKKGR